MNIVFCSSEVFPFVKTGGLADVCGALPLALERLGMEVSIFLPRYKDIKPDQHPLEKINNRVSKTRLGKNIQVYLIEQAKYYQREGLYGDASGDYPDNLERFQYFCRQTLEVWKQLKLKVDIVHCHDWQTALIPVYLKEKFGKDSFYAGIKTVLMIHNLAFQGIFPRQAYPLLGLKDELFNPQTFEYYGQINLLKAGIIYSDQVTTVSRRYAKEIQTKQFGCGLDGVLKSRRDEIVGILNGLDTDVWNPGKDPLIAKRYSSDDFIELKQENKRCLQESFKLPSCEDNPVFGFVGRLSHQKGVDLLLEVMGAMAASSLQMIVLGLGEKEHILRLTEMAERNPKKIAVRFAFDEKTAHQIYAGSDLLLMPSCFEPCGLSQMIALRYGTIPVVYKTGGLADTVVPFDPSSLHGNGFLFEEYTPAAFLTMINRAIKVYGDKKKFSRLVRNAFQCDFSWDKSAGIYARLYKNLL